MSYDAPQSRNEAILQNILGANNVLVDPQSRIEAILQAILYDETYDEEAMSRMEELLLAIKNNGTWNHEPISRNEEILYAKLNGETYDKEPQSRIEALLIDWCNQSPITVVTDISPYLFRQSGGDNNAYVGTEETDKLVGASAVVNQLVNPSSFVSENGITKPTIDENGVISIGGTATATTSRCFRQVFYVTDHRTHVLAMLYKIKANPNNVSLLPTLLNNSSPTVASDYGRVTKISATSSTMGLGLSGLTVNDNYDGVKLAYILIDLTAMFGTAIADYVYSLEQATAGSGIAYLRKYGFFTKDYYPYTANTLQSVNTSKHTMVGKNQYTGDLSHTGVINDNGTRGTASSRLYTSPTKVLPNTSYAINLVGGKSGETIYINRIIEYDVNGVFIRRQTTASAIPYIYSNPSDCCYIVLDLRTSSLLDIESTDISEIQIEFGSTATAYEPYIKHEYALPNIDLRGLYKLDASNNLYADGDTLEGDGTLTRKYGIIDLGQFTWRKVSNMWTTNYGAIPNFKQVKSYYKPINCLCKSYVTGTSNSAPQKDKEITFTINSSYPLIRDDEYDSATSTEFKNHMSGIYLIYELETPTTETATGFTNPQIVDKYGTEEYTDERDFPLPVGHETEYPSR